MIRSELDHTSEDFNQQQTILQQKTTSSMQHKMIAEQVVEQHRNVLRQQKQTESNLRLIANKLQRIESQLSTTTNVLQRHKQEQAAYDSQRNEIRSNAEILNTALKRHDEVIKEYRKKINANQTKLANVTEEQRQQKDLVIKLKGSLDELINSEKITNREIIHQQTLLEAEKKSVEDLRADMDIKQQHIGHIKQEFMKTTTELNKIMNKITSAVQKKTDLQQNIVAKRVTLNSVKNEYIAIRSRIQTQDVIVQDLRRKMNQLNIHDKQLFTDVQHLKGEVNIKSQEMQENQESIREINQKMRRCTRSTRTR
ncbi:unnamed protein product [Didymodactylos carnosus]|uniref:Uncharacterized protein n=2 Tax=Didymodactylos carnosus TaxID=1234261 RepID=A0A815GRC0_9BILA|nr:unnamed protein product [Didymodactylos carnosus]CAF4207550.1 unnamed protein product [Didymodactylos carnosus]